MKTVKELEKELKEAQDREYSKNQEELKILTGGCPFKVGDFLEYTIVFNDGESGMPDSYRYFHKVIKIVYDTTGWVASLTANNEHYIGNAKTLRKSSLLLKPEQPGYTIVHKIGCMLWKDFVL
jgi:hypothetical protein